MTTELNLLRRAVALESLSMRDVSGYLKDIMPNLQNSFKAIAANFSPSQAAVPGLTSQMRDFEKQLNGHPYTSISQVNAFIPEGLDVGYLDYAEVLLEAAKHAAKVTETLAPYTDYLARLVTDREAALSTLSFEREFALTEKERDRINNELGACFKKGSTKAEASIGEVIHRNADWNNLFERMHDISTEINKVNRGHLLKKVQACDSHLEIILKMVRQDKLDRVAGATVTNLADGAYQVASELEFFAITAYKIEVFVACVNQTMEHFQKVMKK